MTSVKNRHPWHPRSSFKRLLKYRDTKEHDSSITVTQDSGMPHQETWEQAVLFPCVVGWLSTTAQHCVKRTSTCFLSTAVLPLVRMQTFSEHLPICELPASASPQFFLTFSHDTSLSKDLRLRYNDEKKSKKESTSFFYLFICFGLFSNSTSWTQAGYHFFELTSPSWPSQGHASWSYVFIKPWCTVPALQWALWVIREAQDCHSWDGRQGKASMKIFPVRLIWCNDKIPAQRSPGYKFYAYKGEKGNTP